MAKGFPGGYRLRLARRHFVVGALLSVPMLVLLTLGSGVRAQASGPTHFDRGQQVAASCGGFHSSLAHHDEGTSQLSCDAPRSAESAFIAEPVDLHATSHDYAPTFGVCGEAMASWHPPVVDGCATGHEHGDAPPDWIAAADYKVSFAGHFNTSPLEATAKHAGMKGFLAHFAEVDLYFRPHVQSNVLDRSARYHSYEVWTRDAQGGVSHWQGWYNSGDPVADRLARRRGPQPTTVPAVLVVDQTSWDQGITCEQWYARTAGWSWDFGWTVCGINTLFYPGENDEQAMSFWRYPPTGPGLGQIRRLEAAWYDNTHQRYHPTGRFYATQFGEYAILGPLDPVCEGTTTKFGTSYKNVCLEQYIAPTMTEVAYPAINAVQKVYDAIGVKVPN